MSPARAEAIQSFGDAPPSPTRRAVRDNCLVLATHADACDMPIVREVWMHLFARAARATPSEVFKALLAWVLREESEAAGLRAIRVLISLEETWKVLPLSDVRGMRVLYHKLLDRASRWDPGGNAKVLWLGHLHRVQARSSLVQQRAALQLEHVVEHVMQSIAGGENLYIVQIALAILYEACLWRQPDAKLAVVLYTPTHQETMEEAMAKLVDESDCYSTAQQACVRYFRYLKDVMSATCIPSEVNFGRFWCGVFGLARAWWRRLSPPHRSLYKFSRCSAWLVLCGGGESRRTAACTSLLVLGRLVLCGGGAKPPCSVRLEPTAAQHKFRSCLAGGGFCRRTAASTNPARARPARLAAAFAAAPQPAQVPHVLGPAQAQPRPMHHFCTGSV